jgi:hypothetical protein
MPRAKSDRAAPRRYDPELKRLEAEHEARRLKIDAYYRERISNIRAYPAGSTELLFYEFNNGRLGTEQEALAEHLRMLNEEGVWFERELRALVLRRELDRSESGDAGAPLPEDELAAMEAAWPKPGAAFYSHRTIEEAVRQVREGTTRNDLAKKYLRSPKDTTRLLRMTELGLFDLNKDDKLWVNSRVRRRKGREIALRYWNGRGWVDPLDPPGQGARLGRT